MVKDQIDMCVSIFKEYLTSAVNKDGFYGTVIAEANIKDGNIIVLNANTKESHKVA